MRALRLLSLLLLIPGLASAQEMGREDILGREVELSLQDAVRLSLAHSLNLEVARTEPLIAGEGVRQATGAYDPFLNAGWGFSDDETATANPLEQADPTMPSTTIAEVTTNTRRWDYTGGLQGTLPLGLEYSSLYNLSRTESDSFFFGNLNPQWNAVWENELRLPLLRDFIDNQTDITVKRSRVNADLSLEDFRRQLIDEVAAVENSYWLLTANLESLRVANKSLETAHSLLEQTQVQYDVGVVSRVAVTQAVSGVAQREFEQIRAKNLAELAQDDLLNRILAPTPGGFAGTTVVPESPTLVQYEVDLDQTVRLALETRPELGVARAQLRDAELAYQLADNQVLPTLDVVGGYTMQGISGEGAPDSAGNPRTFTGKPDSLDSMDAFFRHDGDHSWSFRAEFSVPIPNTTARAVATQRKIELRRARTNLRQTEQRVILEARTAARNLRSALDGIEAAERGKEAAAESLRAEEEKLRLGDSTPFDVLQFEEDLAEAENRLVDALRIYRNAVTELDRSQGRLLSARGISIQEELARY